ncbi:Predicted arabinose efflux permease, MFS family [Bradyrhizobium sp. Ghvi]|nr:Predicted arabinose efflux permease, MFS family [Bradyrhizobium sp. Ghvi]
MSDKTNADMFSAIGLTVPLQYDAFRYIWLTSLLFNLGVLIRGVGAAWAMTQMTASSEKVALVQTAVMLPVMLISMPAGAIADMYDRRIVGLVSLSISLAGATALTTFACFDLITPNLLLALCFVIGCGWALLSPAWQSSVSEQVPPEALPAAVALNSISYNLALSVGPAVGGIVVATAGAVATFALSALLYLPLMVALFHWRRITEPFRPPPERLNRAIVSSLRYITNSRSIKIVLIRTMVTGAIGSGIVALMPLVARDLLHGGAKTYGIMVSAFGLGSVIGALIVTELRSRMSDESAICACALSMGGAIVAVALNREPVLTAASLIVSGGAWMMGWTLLNIGVQLSAPRWMVGRSIAIHQAAGSGGIAFGSWGWGHLLDFAGVQAALLASAGLMLASPLLGLWLRIPRSTQRE